jgi:opacity protein-like surface antigen
MTNIRTVFAAFALAALAHPITADAGQEVIIGGVAAATSIDASTETAVAAAIGVRLNRVAGIGVEVTFVPALKPDVASLDQSRFPASNGSVSGSGGRATIFTTNARIDLPTLTTRVSPYVVGGGGVANLKESFTIAGPASVAGSIPVVIPPRAATQSSTALALTLGGGVSVVIAPHLSLDADARYVRLMSTRDLNIRRFGVGLSYRF